jgi:hypothetical protein
MLRKSARSCEPQALTRITTLKGGGLWLTMYLKNIDCFVKIIDLIYLEIHICIGKYTNIG